MVRMMLGLVVVLGCSKKASESSQPPAPNTVCVDGNQASCARANAQWTGKQCCLPQGSTCVAGNEAACARANGTWSGALCCFDGARTCTDGTEADCVRGHGTWTGAKCCVN